MRCTVILATYNQPAYLELVLSGYAAQTRSDFELIIADDGSGPETEAVIHGVRAKTGMAITHVRHEDRGFRKTTILNRAIVESTGDYLLFSDGDCIPRRDLLEVHQEFAEPGRFLAGGYLKLPASATASITVDDVTAGHFAQLRWLRARGWRPGHRALRLVPSRTLGAVFDRITPTPARFHGNNASAWRDALYAVNGFDGDMGYGSEDAALGRRLENFGVRGKQIRHRAICIHLHHARPYRDPQEVQANRTRMKALPRSGVVRARNGIAELAPDPAFTVNGRAVFAPDGEAVDPLRKQRPSRQM